MRSNNIPEKTEITAAQHIEEKNYWLHNLSGDLTKTCFPYDANSAASGSVHLETVPVMLSTELCNRITELSGGADIRVFIIMVTGLTILLSKYTHHLDIIVGTTIYRQEPNAAFLNTILPIRNHLEDSLTFKDALMQTGKILLDANKYRDYPIKKLFPLLDLDVEDADDFSLFDTAVLFEDLHDREYLRDISINTIFTIKRTGKQFGLDVEYNLLRYKPSTIERIVSHFCILLQNAVADVNKQICMIDIFPDKEKEEILYIFNDTKVEYRRDTTMYRLFEEQAAKTPTNMAVIDNKNSLTYKELNERADSLACKLKKLGLKPNRFAVVIMDRSLEMIIAVIAILKAGGAYVPLEPYLPDSRIIACLSSLDTEWILTGSAQLDKIAKIREELPVISHILCLDQDNDNCEPLPGKNIENSPRPITSEDIAYVIFTSGTTGMPKGVVVKHKPVINLIEWVNKKFAIGGTDKLLFVVSLSFDLSVYDIFGILASGGMVRVAESEDIKSPERLLRIIYEEGITFWDSAPAALQLLVPYLDRLSISDGSKATSKLRLVFLSGDWIPLTLPDILKRTFPGLEVIGLGGATEAVVWSNYYPIGTMDPDWLSIPYGKPIQNARYYILDHLLSPCPIGVPGDLYIGGECLASGYLNDEALTKEKFIANPFCIGEKIYKTGDLAKWFPDGNIEFLGRRDNQVKIRGYRIETGEIENRLLKYMNIKEAVVVAGGEEKEDRYLCAYYTADRLLTPGELNNYLSALLPAYMIPPYFIKLDHIPLTANGKVDRKRLPVPLPAPVGMTYIAPRDKIEEELAGIFAQVLKLKKEHISIDANFFDLGGHSLTATHLVVLIHEKLEIAISLADIFNTPTVRELSKHIQNAAKNSFASIDAVEKKQYYNASSAQKRLYFMQKKEPESMVYNIPGKMILTGNHDKESVQHTLEKLIKRHRSLRTSFHIIDGHVVQRIHDQVDFQLEYDDTLPYGQLMNIITRPFDLSRAPLLRAAVIRRQDKHLLCFGMHHIITDGVSVEILLDEFVSLHNGVGLAPLRIQYNDFAEWQARFSQSEKMTRQFNYWLETLSGEIPVLDLPLDFPRPQVQDFDADKFSFTIDKELRERIRDVETKSGSTLFMILLAAFDVLLMKYSGQEDFFIGSPVAGRHHADLLGVVGMFVNLLVLRNRPQIEKTFAEFLSEVHTNCIQAFENQDVPFEELVDRLVPKIDPSHHPLFDVCFFLQNFSEKRNLKREQREQDINQQRVNRFIQFDMELGAYEMIEEISLYLGYSKALYNKSTIEKFAGRYMQILDQVVNDMDIKLNDITVTSKLLPLPSNMPCDEEGDFGL